MREKSRLEKFFISQDKKDNPTKYFDGCLLEFARLIKDLEALDYLSTRHYEQKHIIAKDGTIDNPKYDDGLSLDNGEILAIFKTKQEKRNRINEIEAETGCTKEELQQMLDDA